MRFRDAGFKEACDDGHRADGSEKPAPGVSPRQVAGAAANAAAPVASGLHLLGEVVLITEPVHERQLGFQPVHVLFLGLEDTIEDLAADIVTH